MSRRVATEDDVLDEFATAYRADANALGAFLARYPEHGEALVDYVGEIDLQRAARANRSITPDEDAWVDSSASIVSDMLFYAGDPFAAWQSSDYADARKVLGVPAMVVASFRDRLVNIATVPRGFVQRLAERLRIETSQLIAFSCGRPRLAPSMSYKSDAAPQAPTEKVSFEAVLATAGVTPDRIVELLEGDS